MDRSLVELGDKLNQGFITRREFARRAALITGSWAAAFAALQTCSPAPAATAAAPASPTAAIKSGGTFISAKTTEIGNLDPHLDATLTRTRIAPLLYNRLIKLGFDLSIQPDLAESWEVKSDGREIVFKLRKGVMWHPPVNRELNADDIKFSYGRLAAESPQKSDYATIQDVEVVDKHTVAFHLSQPNAGLLAVMAYPYGNIVSKETVEKNGDLKKVAVGTGPFMLEEWVPQSELRLTKNSNYFTKGRPYVDKLVLKVIPEESSIVAGLRANSVHHAMLEENKNFDLLKNEKNLVSYRTSRLGYDMVVINFKEPPFDKPQVPQAVSWAVDREEMVKVVTQGHAVLTAPATPPMKLWQLPKDKWAPFYKPDLDKARSLLAAAGFPNGFKTKLSVVPTYPSMVAGAQVIQANLKRVGIDVEIENVEYGIWIKRWGAKQFVMTMNITGGSADPDGAFYFRWHSKALNPSNFIDPEMDRLLDQGKATFDFNKRKAIYDQVQMIVLQRVPQIYSFCPDMIDFTQDYVKGFQQHPTTHLAGFEEVWLNK